MFAASKTDAAAGGYQISRSLRFNSVDSAYLNRTPASAGNQKTWTWSAWVKRSTLGTLQTLFASYSANTDADAFAIIFGSGDTISVLPWSNAVFTSNAVFRDPSAWYHIVVAFNSTQATASNRVIVYVNGVNQAGTYPIAVTQNTDYAVNAMKAHRLGDWPASGFNTFGGYMIEINFVDGQALTPSSFGETNAQTGVWGPKVYSGSYGTNGFYLNFSDNSNTTAATLGKDYSGNGNNWTPNNFSVTAGAGNDSLVDSPTSYGTDTGVGGTVRGNYATWNPVASSSYATLSNGNLDALGNTAADNGCLLSTIGVTSGKWYWEETIGTVVTSYPRIGAMFAPATNGTYPGRVNGVGYVANGNIERNGSSVTTVASFTTGDVIGMALDLDNLTIAFYKNNTLQYTATALTAGTYFLGAGQYNGSTSSVNFGQRPFAYTAPAGFKALCTQNLPTPTIGATTATLANKYFDTVLRTGAGGGTYSTTVNMANGALLWNKTRNQASSNYLMDSVRGIANHLRSNQTGPEVADASWYTAFNNGSYTTGASDWTSPTTVVDWIWAAGAGTSNTSGSITSTVGANTTSGFSIVTYTGTGANATVGHGLGVAPSMVIVKVRSTTDGWFVYNKEIGNTNYLRLNTTDAASTFNLWQSTTPTSNVFSIATDPTVNGSGNTYVAYCFAPVAGYSAFGSYTGNGSSAGPFVYCGFRPAFIMLKSAGTGQWCVFDCRRNPTNGATQVLQVNNSSTEGGFTSSEAPDLLSNGFRLNFSYGDYNTSGQSYIFAAFAESPFKYSLAR